MPVKAKKKSTSKAQNPANLVTENEQAAYNNARVIGDKLLEDLLLAHNDIQKIKSLLSFVQTISNPILKDIVGIRIHQFLLSNRNPTPILIKTVMDAGYDIKMEGEFFVDRPKGRLIIKTIVMIASTIVNDNLSLFKILLDHIDINAWRTESGETALIFALKYRKKEQTFRIAEYLVSHKLVDLTASDNEGDTALSLAMSSPDTKNIMTLIRNSAFTDDLSTVSGNLTDLWRGSLLSTKDQAELKKMEQAEIDSLIVEALRNYPSNNQKAKIITQLKSYCMKLDLICFVNPLGERYFYGNTRQIPKLRVVLTIHESFQKYALSREQMLSIIRDIYKFNASQGQDTEVFKAYTLIRHCEQFKAYIKDIDNKQSQEDVESMMLKLNLLSNDTKALKKIALNYQNKMEQYKEFALENTRFLQGLSSDVYNTQKIVQHSQDIVPMLNKLKAELIKHLEAMDTLLSKIDKKMASVRKLKVPKTAMPSLQLSLKLDTPEGELNIDPANILPGHPLYSVMKQLKMPKVVVGTAEEMSKVIELQNNPNSKQQLETMMHKLDLRTNHSQDALDQTLASSREIFEGFNSLNATMSNDMLGSLNNLEATMKKQKTRIEKLKKEISEKSQAEELEKNQQTEKALAEKIAKSMQQTQLDTIELDKQKHKGDLSKKLAHDKSMKAAELQIEKDKEQEMQDQQKMLINLNAIYAALTVDTTQFNKVAPLTLSAAADIVPKVTVTEAIQPIIKLLNVISNANTKTAAEDLKQCHARLLVERSALLCLFARLMEGIKGFKETAIFSSAHAEKLRDVIFHYGNDIFTEIDFNLIQEKIQLNVNVYKNTNAEIGNMVMSIVAFMQNDAAQKACKGNWKLIEANLKSPLLTQLLSFEEFSRQDLKQILLKLGKAEEKLKNFESILRLSTASSDHQNLLKQALYFAYAELGACASDLKKHHPKAYHEKNLDKCYDLVIARGNDVRHGRIPDTLFREDQNIPSLSIMSDDKASNTQNASAATYKL